MWLERLEYLVNMGLFIIQKKKKNKDGGYVFELNGT